VDIPLQGLNDAVVVIHHEGLNTGNLMDPAIGDNRRTLETRQTRQISSNNTVNSVNNVNTPSTSNCTNSTSSCTVRGCRSSRCKLCDKLVKSKRVKSSNSGREYECIFETTEAHCHSVNLIYLITCENCQLQYVGQTVQQLSDRMNQHRSGKLGTTGCKVLTEHFKSHPCNGYSFSVQILQTLPGTGRNEYGIEDLAVKSKRVNIEEEWMVKLRTVYPYGLNDKCHGRLWTNPSEGVYTGRSLFRKLERSDSNPSLIRCLKSRKNPRPVVITLSEIENACDCSQNSSFDNPCAPCTLNSARKIILSATKPIAKNLATLILDKIYSNNKVLPVQFYEAILDLINSKFAPKIFDDSKQKSKPTVILKILFNDKHVQDLDIPRLLRDTDLLKSIPADFSYRKPPTIVYKHLPPIRNKIFNYSKEVLNFDIDDFLMKELQNENECNCSSSPFVDAHHNHVITGNLDIIENTSLKTLLKQGPNYREQNSKTNFSQILKNVKSGIKECIEVWTKKENAPIESLAEWKAKLLTKVNAKLDKIKKYPRKVPLEVLKDPSNVKDLEELHSKYIFVPVDKASNNVSLICKPYYFRILISELGLSENESATYELLNNSENDLVKMQKRFLNAVAPNLPCKSNNLPFLYAIPKLHKSPVKFRFLVSQKECPLKSLNQTLTKILKLVYLQHKKWCNSIYNYTGINYMWVADNFNDVLQKIDKINARTKGVSTKQFDFSTLYTSLPKDFLIEKLNWCLEKAFIGGKKQFISVYSNEAKFVNSPQDSTLHFSLTKIKNILKCVIKHSFLKLGNKTFNQINGIAMGWDPAPFAANLALYSCEHIFQAKLIKQNYNAAKQNNNNCRYIDDINTLNNQVFEDQIHLIYPQEIICNRENANSDRCGHFLEIDINIKLDKFQTKIYDKRNDFNFPIVKFPDTKSNIPNRVVFNVYISQLLRFLRVCSEIDDFKTETKMLISCFLLKGCNRQLLVKKTIQTLKKHSKTFNKFNISPTEFSNQIF
jgi:hypothetical protein